MNKKLKSLATYHKEIKKSIDIPGALAQLLVESSADFAAYSEMFAEKEIARAKYIKLKTDEDDYSVAKAENDWLTTPEGEKWIFLKHYLRGLKQINKSIESATYMANQGFNIHQD